MNKAELSIRKVLSIAILTGTFMSCSKSDLLELPDQEQAPILLESKVSIAQSRLQNEQIEDKGTLSFFVTKASDTNDILYDNILITANGGGGFSYAIPMYYPVGDTPVDFYALHPYDAGASVEPENVTVPFNITANQINNTDYLNSDLLYATAKNITRTKYAVKLEFKHMLSKISFNVIAGNGMDLADLTAITIMDVKPSTTINLLTGAISEAVGENAEVTANGVKGTSGSENEVSGSTAVIVPQTILTGHKLFKVTIGSNNYYYTNEKDITYKSGYNYNYTLTIHQSGIDVSSSITEWGNGGSVIGDGLAED